MPPPPVEVPEVNTVLINDPVELLTCRDWPLASQPLSSAKQPVDEFVALIVQGKAAWQDCHQKIAGVAAFQKNQGAAR